QAKYEELLLKWDAIETSVPTLLVRASEPIVEYHDGPWRSRWPLEHTAVDVPGDHLTMMQDHADTTARCVEDFLRGPST
ncbi:MAG TPA: hypothetical protein VNP92_01295, partial [Actinophytocola sp.]|nr:hypothetical protein [Actinophytocola sp.]